MAVGHSVPRSQTALAPQDRGEAERPVTGKTLPEDTVAQKTEADRIPCVGAARVTPGGARDKETVSRQTAVQAEDCGAETLRVCERREQKGQARVSSKCCPQRPPELSETAGGRGGRRPSRQQARGKDGPGGACLSGQRGDPATRRRQLAPRSPGQAWPCTRARLLGAHRHHGARGER